MSESSSSESSYSYSSSKPSKHSSSESSESNYTSSASPSKVEDTKLNISQIKQKLQVIEIFVSKNLNNEEKSSFVKFFRDIIVENEQQVMTFPTATFFIAKFEELQSPILNENLKEKILNNLYLKQNEEKQYNSKLKYW